MMTKREANQTKRNEMGKDKFGQRVFEGCYLNPPAIGTRVVLTRQGFRFPGIVVDSSELVEVPFGCVAFRCDDVFGRLPNVSDNFKMGFRAVSPTELSPEAGYTVECEGDGKLVEIAGRY